MKTRWTGLVLVVLAMAGLACSFSVSLTQPAATAGPPATVASATVPPSPSSPGGKSETPPEDSSAPPPVPPAGTPTQRLTLVNNSGTSVCYVYISPTTDTTWGADWLGSTETIANGASRAFDVTSGSYDLRADDCSHTALSTQWATSITAATTWTVGTTSGPALPSGSTSFTVHNNTSSSIFYLYISPTTSPSWGDDWLGSSTIPAGGSYTFTVPNGSYDLKAEDSSHNVLATWMGVSIPPTTSWNVTGGSPPASTSFIVHNQTTGTVCYVYISPTTSPSWGNDWLGADTIPAGGSYTFSVPNGSYDLKAEDCSHNVIATRMGVAIPPTTSWNVTGGSSGTTSFTAYNNTGSTIFYLYISPSSSPSWGNDWLGSSTIPAGGSYTFTVPNGTYDLKAEDSSHNVLATWMGVSIPPTTSWNVTGGSSGTTSFTAHNNTGSTIFYLYISPSSSPSWGNDWLGSSTIPAGGSYTFTVPNGTYDLKAEDSSHNVLATWMGVSIPPTTSWNVTGGSSGTTSFTVYNNTGSTIFYLYISPSSSPSWGDDWLGADTIPAGGSYTFTVPNGTYDLKAEGSSHNVLSTRMGVSIPPTTSWSVP